jgi:hypothetical protein
VQSRDPFSLAFCIAGLRNVIVFWFKYWSQHPQHHQPLHQQQPLLQEQQDQGQHQSRGIQGHCDRHVDGVDASITRHRPTLLSAAPVVIEHAGRIFKPRYEVERNPIERSWAGNKRTFQIHNTGATGYN